MFSFYPNFKFDTFTINTFELQAKNNNIIPIVENTMIKVRTYYNEQKK